MHYGFEYPLFLTAGHMLVSWGGCVAYRKLRKESPPPDMHIGQIAPLAACTIGTIAFGNISLIYLYPSFASMLGSATPVAVMLLQAVFTDTVFNHWVFLSVPMITIGIVICTQAEVSLNWIGVLAQAVATLLRAAKTIIQKNRLCVRDSIGLSPVQLLELMAPHCTLLALLGMLVMEGVTPIVEILDRNEMQLNWIVLLNCMNACLLNVSNFEVSKRVWPITLQLIGSVKTVAGTLLSVVIFGNEVTPVQWIGSSLTILGAALYHTFGDAGSEGGRARHKPAGATGNSME